MLTLWSLYLIGGRCWMDTGVFWWSGVRILVSVPGALFTTPQSQTSPNKCTILKFKGQAKHVVQQNIFTKGVNFLPTREFS